MLINTKKWIYAILITVLLCTSSIYAILRLNHDPTLEGPESSTYAHMRDRTRMDETAPDVQDENTENDIAANEERELFPNDLLSDNVFIRSSRERTPSTKKNSTDSNAAEEDWAQNDNNDETISGLVAIDSADDDEFSLEANDSNASEEELVALNDNFEFDLVSTDDDLLNGSLINANQKSNLDNDANDLNNNVVETTINSDDSGNLEELLAVNDSAANFDVASENTETKVTPFSSENVLDRAEGYEERDKVDLKTTETILDELKTIAEKETEDAVTETSSVPSGRDKLVAAAEAPPDIGEIKTNRNFGKPPRRGVSRVVDLRTGGKPGRSDVAARSSVAPAVVDSSRSDATKSTLDESSKTLVAVRAPKLDDSAIAYDVAELVKDAELTKIAATDIAFDDVAVQPNDIETAAIAESEIALADVEQAADIEAIEADETEIAFDDNAVQLEEVETAEDADLEIALADVEQTADIDAIEADVTEIAFDDNAEQVEEVESTEADETEIAFDDNAVQLEEVETAGDADLDIALNDNVEQTEDIDAIEADVTEIAFDDNAEQVEEVESTEVDETEIAFDDNVEQAEEVETTEIDETEIAFDDNVEQVEEVETSEVDDTEIAFDDNVEQVEEVESIEVDDTEIVFDDNVEQVEEVESVETETTEIVFDDNAEPVEEVESVETEAKEIVFDENEVQVEEVETTEVDDSEIVFDDNAEPVEEVETLETETTEIVFDENDVQVEKVETTEVDDSEIVFDDNAESVEEVETVESDTPEIVFDENEDQVEEVETTDSDESEIVFDDNGASEDATILETNEGEIIFDSNDYRKDFVGQKEETNSDESEILFDDNDVQEKSNGDPKNTDEQDGVIIFDSNDYGFAAPDEGNRNANQSSRQYFVRQASWSGSETRVRPVSYCVRLGSEEPEVQETSENVEPTNVETSEKEPAAENADGSERVESETLDAIEEAFAGNESKDENVESIHGAETEALEKIEDALIVGENVEEEDAEKRIEEATTESAVVSVAPSANGTPTQTRAPQIAKIQAQDETWIISPNGGDDYMCWQLVNGSWAQTNANAFFATDDPARTTVFWAHGYQTDMTSAVNSGFALRSALEVARQASGSQKRIRLVIWKWASERNTARIRLDAMIKRDLTQYYGASLGRFAGRLNPRGDVVFVGFSFGAGLVGSALQTLATTANRRQTGDNEPGFAVSGQGGSTPAEQKGKISLILVAGACDLGAFGRGGEYEYGGYLPSLVLNLYNPVDYALHYYPAVANRSQALGIAPASNEEFPNAWGNIYNINVSGALARKHSFSDAINATPYNVLIPFVL